MTGYSDTRLAETLGFARGMRVWFDRMPDSVRARIDPDALGLDELVAATDGLNGAILFCTQREKLERALAALRTLLEPNGLIWVAWPSADDASDIDAEAIRTMARPLALTETMTHAIDPDWNGLKLVCQRDAR